jgi:hypothetical protein
VVDVTERPVNRPKRGENIIFGKRYTLKMRVIIERNSRQIIGVREANGSGHDFRI